MKSCASRRFGLDKNRAVPGMLRDSNYCIRTTRKTRETSQWTVAPVLDKLRKQNFIPIFLAFSLSSGRAVTVQGPGVVCACMSMTGSYHGTDGQFPNLGRRRKLRLWTEVTDEKGWCICIRHTMILIGTDLIIGSYPCFKLNFFNRDSIKSTEGV